MEKYKYRSMNIMFNVMVMYGVKNSIFSLRELEYRIKQDYVFQSIINLKQGQITPLFH